MGLEPYEGRYTLQLEQWSEAAFRERGIDYEIVRGETLDNSKAIVTGASIRCAWTFFLLLDSDG